MGGGADFLDFRRVGAGVDERELVGVDSAELEAATDELRDRFSGLGELLPSLSFRFLHRGGTAPGERKPILAGDGTALPEPTRSLLSRY